MSNVPAERHSQQHEIKINLLGLLKMLGSNIYAEPDVAVRELIQNAHDIQREQLREAQAQEALLLIGQFGIGLLSAFSVADTVEVYTRSCEPGAPAFRWVCQGDIHYTIEETDFQGPGSRVVLHLSDSSLVLLDEARLRQAIKKYADFISVPIYLKGRQANVCTPPWSKAEGQADYAEYVRERYNLYPLAILPFQLDDPIPLDGLLFVPMIPFELTRDFGEVDVYISRMFIKADDGALLPTWARFIKGVINSPALTPTVSRDELVRDAAWEQVRAVLGELILGYLAFWEKKDPNTLNMVVQAYNNTIKARAVDDSPEGNAFFDRICDLARVSTSDGLMSMRDYLIKSNGVIYYFSERGTGTQHKLLFAHKGLPVIDASWGVEEEFLEKYAARKQVKLERLEAGSGIIFKPLETADEKWQELERQFRLLLRKEARAVTFEPGTVPAVLVARPLQQDDKELAQLEAMGQELGFSSGQMRQLFQKMSREKGSRAAGDDTILQLNIANPLMQQLCDMNRNETFSLALTAIYNNALMFAHHYVSPENAEIIFTTNNAAISAMIGSARAVEQLQGQSARMEIELDELKRRVPQVKLSAHRSCFFAFDYNVEDNYELMRLLQEYFAQERLGIEIIAPAKGVHDLNMLKAMYDQLDSVHFGLAEITGNNPNVLYEAGLLKGQGKPVILLKEKDTEAKTLFDLFSDYRVEYGVMKFEREIDFQG